MYQIEITNQQNLLDIDEALIRNVVTKTLEIEEVAAAEISVAIIDDPAIHTLNKQHLQHDYPTDVLSFLFNDEFEESPPPLPPGEGQLPSRRRRKQGEGQTQVEREAPESTPPRGHNKRIDGEIIVSAETALNTAADFDIPPHAELLLYVVHGLLHLAGYDDIDDDERLLMRSREAAILKLCELSPRVDS